MDYSNCSIGENNRSILIVDDAAVSRIQLKRIFSSEYTVFVAENGQLAMDILNSGTEMTAVVLDIMMPVMDGIALALATARDFPALPILLMTGFADQRERAFGLDSLVYDVVPKPFTLADIRQAVGRALASRGGGEARASA